MDIAVISVIAFFTAILTFFSGFGLGTILLPVFAIFFPVEIAVALTGVVHFSNNLFKITLVGRNADRSVLVRFGIPAILASFAGAWLLVRLTAMPSILSYELGGREFEITPVKLAIAAILLIFSLLEIIPLSRNLHFGREALPLGGLLSGFFGGLAGIQGAIRSAFLIRSGLTKEAYIATGVLIASLVDIARLSVYVSRFKASGLEDNILPVLTATAAAMAGAFTGSRLLRKVTMNFIRMLVTILLIVVSVALGAGFI